MNTSSNLGERLFAPPYWALPVLLPLWLVYRALIGWRGLIYRLGWIQPWQAACPVIAVGNLTVGGSGKTPMVDHLLREVLAAGKRPVVLSRGHGRRTRTHLSRSRADENWPPDPKALGDEPALLSRRNPAVPVYTGPDRAAAARLAALLDAPDLIVLDDAYQHWRLSRDLNVLVVDAGRGLGNGRVLPLGPLREPLREARRADVVLLTKAEAGAETALEALRRELAPHLRVGIPVFTCGYRARRVRTLDASAEIPVERYRGRTVSLICGIAHPGGFVRSVEALGATVAEVRRFPDHHPYGGEDLARLDAALSGPAAEGREHPDAASPPRWLTTEKDAVKLEGRLEHPDKLGVLEMEMAPEPAAQAFFFDFITQCGIK